MGIVAAAALNTENMRPVPGNNDMVNQIKIAMKKTILLTILATVFIGSYAQVGIGTNTPNASAMLDVSSSSKGFLLTRMTTLQRNAILSPAAGLLVFDTDKSTLYLYDGDQWLPLLLGTGTTLTAITATTPSPDDQYGVAVAVFGNTAIVGAPLKTVDGHQYQGAAFIFERINDVWTQQQQQELLQGDGAAGDLFGGAVAIYGNTAVVGAYNKTESGKAGQGAVYVFNKNGSAWTMQKKLVSPGGQANENFGKSVSVYDNRVLVGTPKKNINGNLNGTVYLFTNNAGTWTSIELTPNNSSTLSNYGNTVSVSTNLAVVGGGGRSSIFVFFYLSGNWNFLSEIKPNDVTGNDNFGTSVCAALGGDYVVAGAPDKTIGNNAGQGAIYYIKPTSPVAWEEQRLVANDGAAGDRLGVSVSAVNNYIVGGASGKTIKNMQNRGAAYLFLNDGGVWKQQQKSFASDGAADNYFGFSVGITTAGIPPTIVIGAPGRNANAGAVYFTGF